MDSQDGNAWLVQRLLKERARDSQNGLIIFTQAHYALDYTAELFIYLLQQIVRLTSDTRCTHVTLILRRPTCVVSKLSNVRQP